MECPDCGHNLTILRGKDFKEELGWYCEYCSFIDPDDNGKFFDIDDERLLKSEV